MQVCYNGHFLAASTPLFTAANRGFKYGDGIFETARVANGKLLLAPYHFERLAVGLELLQIVTPADFRDTIHALLLKLCRQNGCAASARVRLALFRGADDAVEYLIEAFPTEPRSSSLLPEGWRLDVYPNALKTCDSFSSLKSANYLPYLMASRHAADNGLDECLLLNHRSTIADGSKTNIFLLADGIVYTPPLSAGCVAGVMRRHVIEKLRQDDQIVREEDLSVARLQKASEVFVTNAMEGARWVESFGTTRYGNEWITKQYPLLFTGI